MFPTFDVPPQHAETVGARKARKAREDEITRRSSSATSHSSGSIAAANGRRQTVNSSDAKTSEKSSGGFGWFGKKKGVQEISTLPSLKRAIETPIKQQELEPDVEPAPRTAPLSPGALDGHSLRSEHYHNPPPSSTLPSLPPTTALPRPPSSGLLSTLERKSHYSTTSSLPTTNTTASSSRTAFSNRSVFSNNSHYEEPLAQDDYVDPHYASNLQLEPVERGSRTGSRQSDHVSKGAQAPFARALAKMENASARIISARLGEEWDGLDDDESYQEVIFEKRLWALTAYQRLTQNKQMQSPAHEIISSSRPADQRRILHLHGSLADGWVLATRYPAATVYTLSSKKSSTSPTAYPAPLNHHSLYVPSLSSATPFPDGYFDAIITRSVATVFRNDEWARSFFDCMRVLKPGGQIEVLSIDAHLSCEGPRLTSWVDEHLSCRLEAYGLSKQASDTVLDTMEIVGLENIRRARVALPAHSPKAVPRAAPPPSHTFGNQLPAPSAQDTTDTLRMMAFLGRHFYQDLYSKFLHAAEGEEWFWARKDIKEECERYKTKMVLTIACAQKPAVSPGSESYLNI